MNELDKQSCSEEPQVFAIKDCALIAIATGFTAFNLKELRDILSTVDLASVYYHFWGGLLQPRFEEREYNNDFAAWVWYGLHDASLAERLAVVDPREFQDLEELRQELLELIENRLEEKEYLFFKHANQRFEFIRSQIVIFDTMKRVGDPESLAKELLSLSTSSIFYHFIDTRNRLENCKNDFSAWLSGFGEPHTVLCDQLNDIDPYFSTLTEIKAQLVNVFSAHFG